MRTTLASVPAPGRENEDAMLHVGSLIGVFDGVTSPQNVDTGCAHSPTWYVRRLTARLSEAAESNPTQSLADTLADAIERVRGDHGEACDLANPATPAATVCLARATSTELEFLILSDCTLVIDQGDEVIAITDERFAATISRLRQIASAAGKATPPAQAHTPGKYSLVNQPDGYWIAGANPLAAHRAVTGQLPLAGTTRVRRAALLTDGTSCAVDPYRLTDWRGLLDILTEDGPHVLIQRVRQAEASDPTIVGSRFKRHDDATAALCLFEEFL